MPWIPLQTGQEHAMYLHKTNQTTPLYLEEEEEGEEYPHQGEDF